MSQPEMEWVASANWPVRDRATAATINTIGYAPAVP